MSAADLTARIELTVPFYHCDPLFVVWHGRYLEYFELARTALLARFELDVPQIRDLGFRMYVSDARCRYTYPLSYGDNIEVQARFVEVSPLLRVSYEVRNLTKKRKSARGYTVLATTNSQGQLLPETPNEILQRLHV